MIAAATTLVSVPTSVRRSAAALVLFRSPLVDATSASNEQLKHGVHCVLEIKKVVRRAMAVVASGKSESLKDAYTPLLIHIFNQSYSSLHSASVCAHPTLPAINACDDSGRESKCVDRDPDALAFRRQHANEVLLDDRRILNRGLKQLQLHA